MVLKRGMLIMKMDNEGIKYAWIILITTFCNQ